MLLSSSPSLFPLLSLFSLLSLYPLFLSMSLFTGGTNENLSKITTPIVFKERSNSNISSFFFNGNDEAVNATYDDDSNKYIFVNVVQKLSPLLISSPMSLFTGNTKKNFSNFTLLSLKKSNQFSPLCCFHCLYYLQLKTSLTSLLLPSTKTQAASAAVFFFDDNDRTVNAKEADSNDNVFVVNV